MAFVECDRIAGHEATHDLAQRCLARPPSFTLRRGGQAGAEEEVKMVWNQGPRVALGLSLIKDSCKPFKKSLPVFIVFEDIATFNPTGHYMV